MTITKTIRVGYVIPPRTWTRVEGYLVRHTNRENASVFVTYGGEHNGEMMFAPLDGVGAYWTVKPV